MEGVRGLEYKNSDLHSYSGLTKGALTLERLYNDSFVGLCSATELDSEWAQTKP